jgi:hypothetical protein
MFKKVNDISIQSGNTPQNQYLKWAHTHLTICSSHLENTFMEQYLNNTFMVSTILYYIHALHFMSQNLLCPLFKKKISYCNKWLIYKVSIIYRILSKDEHYFLSYRLLPWQIYS